MRKMKLSGKVALVTGGATGIGRATSLLLAAEGAKVVVADIDQRGGEQTVRTIRRRKGAGAFIRADVSKASHAEKMVRFAVSSYGRLDILFNNAGIAGPNAPIHKLSEEDWDRVMNVNLKGVFLGSRYVVPQMIRQGGGVVINTASELGLVGSPGHPAYSASKGGVIALTKAMAVGLAKHNIRVNCVCPGATDTALLKDFVKKRKKKKELQKIASDIPMKRLGRPEDIAKAVLYLACDDSSYVTGTYILVDGGSTA
ncbi:MAG: glucose 1-dehydrogenase [Aigarchaeota archaeon]|nr:glucose 1-dehydrogenase [Aigarchaeota archaeon]